MKILLPFYLVVLICASCSPAEPPITEIVKGDIGLKLQEQLDPFVRQILEDHDCESSVAIGVIKGNEIIYAKAFGYAKVETKDTANIQTIYHLSSLSKPVVATALVKLQHQGKVKLDDPLIKHLPYFKLKSPDYNDITIKQILTHTSGLPSNVGKDDWETPSYDVGALERYVKGIQDAELEFTPGTDHSYSNTGFNILGDVIAKASGISFEDYVSEHIFMPAGMTASTFSKPNHLPENWAAPHIVGTSSQPWEYYPYNRMYAPSSSLNSNVVDMCQWAMINLNNGGIGDRVVLDTTSHGLLLQPWSDTPWGEKIGLSWYLQSYEGMKTIVHTGADVGFSSQFILYPEEDIGIVVMANRDYSRTARLANATMEIIKDLGVKTYTVSGRFPFSKEWEENGLDSAKSLWNNLLIDTTDIYYATEWEMNSIGHGLIFTEEYEKAKAAFNFNIELFPESANTYDSYGDALLSEGDTLGAIGYFRKALEVKPDFGDPGPKLLALGVSLDK